MPLNTPRGYPYPVYGDINNFPAQIGAFATAVDTDVAAIVARINNALNYPSVRISATANQAVAANTDVFCTFAVEDYDNNSMANLGVNNDRITFTTAGIYLVSAEVNFLSNGNATVNGRRVNLVDQTLASVAFNNLRGGQSLDTEETTPLLYQAAAGNFMRVQVRQNSGAALNISARSLTATRVA